LNLAKFYHVPGVLACVPHAYSRSPWVGALGRNTDRAPPNQFIVIAYTHADTTKIQLKQIAYTLSFYSLVLSPFIFACLEYIHFRRHISALLKPDTI